jgi:hypothetical protein
MEYNSFFVELVILVVHIVKVFILWNSKFLYVLISSPCYLSLATPFQANSLGSLQRDLLFTGF